jgi:hypothetical protein
MGEWLSWVLVAGIGLLVVCIYLLSMQLERSIHLAVSIIAANQHRILERIDQISARQAVQPAPPTAEHHSPLPSERRVAQRRRGELPSDAADGSNRRRSPGRRREDLALMVG